MKREPVYEGFVKSGEALSCSACGFVFLSEKDVPYKDKEEAPEIFTDADRSPVVKIFEADEAGGICRHCANYVVNPFMQFCSHHKKEVQATDNCSDFKPASEVTPKKDPLGGI